MTLSARSDYKLTCHGHKPVTWHPPHHDLSERLKITHGESRDGGYFTILKIKHLVYTDTGSYVCSFNESRDITAQESSAKIYIFVFDSIHLLTNTGFDFQQSVAYKSADIPCRPTHPNVSVSLTLEGKGPVNLDNTFIKFNPQVGYTISPVLQEHIGQYWCEARYNGKSSDYGISLNVLTRTR